MWPAHWNFIKWISSSYNQSRKKNYLDLKTVRPYCIFSNNDTWISELTAANNVDPTDVLEEPQGLSQIENILIAIVHPVISQYKMYGGQTANSGQVINLNKMFASCFIYFFRHQIKQMLSLLLSRTQRQASLILEFKQTLNVFFFGWIKKQGTIMKI